MRKQQKHWFWKSKFFYFYFFFIFFLWIKFQEMKFRLIIYLIWEFELIRFQNLGWLIFFFFFLFSFQFFVVDCCSYFHFNSYEKPQTLIMKSNLFFCESNSKKQNWNFFLLFGRKCYYVIKSSVIFLIKKTLGKCNSQNYTRIKLKVRVFWGKNDFFFITKMVDFVWF